MWNSRENGRVNILRFGSMVLDLMIAAASFFIAYCSAYGLERLPWVPGLEEKTAAFTVICGVCFIIFGVNKGSWRYVSVIDLVAITKAVIVAVGIYTVGAFLVSRGENVPRSVPVFSAFFLITGLTAVRITYRLAMSGDWKSVSLKASASTNKRNVILLGLSNNAESFIRAARRSRDDETMVAGIFDDDKINHSKLIQGIKVIGSLSDVKAYVDRIARNGYNISELIITEDKPTRQRLNQILETGAAAGLKVTRIPDATTTSSVTSNLLLQPKPIELQDLLGREEIVADTHAIGQLINNRVILATGAGGSIGSELCRQIASFKPRKLIITDSSEFHLYLLDKHLRRNFPKLTTITRLVDVRDAGRVSNVFQSFLPDVVFHTAALKHVALGEQNPLESIKTNILGTRNVADAALANRASSFVLVSTDKAVNPSNVMGATKRAAEAYCQSLDVSSANTRFKTVRFGNVLGSNGSVVPKFQEQIAAGGPVTVTDPKVARYFMTIPEAVQLVLNASAHALQRKNGRGKIMVLDMGKPVRIVDLAERMIQLAGYKPHVDIEISFIGLQPGEKLSEELFDPSETREPTNDQDYVLASSRIINKAVLAKSLSGLDIAVAQENAERALELLRHLVPEYTKQSIDASSKNDRKEI